MRSHSIDCYRARINHLTVQICGSDKKLCAGTVHCQSRFRSVQVICTHHHSNADLLRVISIFCWGATPLSKSTSQSWAVRLVPDNAAVCPQNLPKTSLSLFLCFSLGPFLHWVQKKHSAINLRILQMNISLCFKKTKKKPSLLPRQRMTACNG